MDTTSLGNAVSVDEPPSKRQKLDQPPQNEANPAYYHQRIIRYVDQELTRMLPGSQVLEENLEKQVLENLANSDLLFCNGYNFEKMLAEYVQREINNVARRETERLKASQPGSLPAAVRTPAGTATSLTSWPATSQPPLPLPARPSPGYNEVSSRVARQQEAMGLNSDNEVGQKLSEPIPLHLAEPLRAIPPAAPSRPPRPPTRPVEQHLGKPKREVPTSPTNFRARAHSSLWHGKQKEEHRLSEYFTEKKRPYLAARTRQNLSHSTSAFLPIDPTVLQKPVAVHFDFAPEEVARLRAAARQAVGAEPKERRRDMEKDLGKQLTRMKKKHIPVSTVIKYANIPRRSARDVEQYLMDVLATNKHVVKKPTIPAVVTVQRDPYDQHASFARSSQIPRLLFSREITGHRGHHGAMRARINFANEFQKCRDDELELREEWTNCAGDISTIVWVTGDNFICGTTEHSDAHNQQYNKPGNLVLGSCRTGTLRAYPDHRIVRPIVEKGENSTHAMRESQDPWLYTSVVSSDCDPNLGLVFTSGFDTTVKIWKVEDDSESGPAMKVQGTWKHDGNVNFVVCSKHKSGMVATAADVATHAIRIYRIRNDAIGLSPSRAYSCSRVTDEFGNTVSTEKWAYFPATMQWGQSDEVQHLLLVGYSPRSRTGDDNDIPLDRRDSGELCLWDGLTGKRWKITSATTQNVFEVLWHPSQPSFIAATSPLGLDTDEGVRTQIRIFRLSDNPEYGGTAFGPVQMLDCSALDINELTIMPNSFTYCYVSAACTDGKVYVWDTARGDKPVQILRHGEPIDEYRGDREREDVGVKFTAWGSTPDRFYTGSSDGVVKVWNIRSHKKPLVRDLLEAPGPITCGLFSPDRSKLVVGDATGRVFLLSLDASDDDDDDDDDKTKKSNFTTLRLPNGKTKVIRPPKSIIYHEEPAPPEYNADGSLAEPESSRAVLKRAKQYLASQQLMLDPENRHWVVQGPRYGELGLYRRDWHLDDDPDKPLLAKWEMLQGEYNKRCRGSRPGRSGGRQSQQLLRSPGEDPLALEWHTLNTKNDSTSSLDVMSLSEETKMQLFTDGVGLKELENPDYVFNYEDDIEGEF